jgi:hypothetical protein
MMLLGATQRRVTGATPNLLIQSPSLRAGLDSAAFAAGFGKPRETFS